MFSQSLPRREFVLSVQTRAKTPATISPNYLLGESRAGHPHPMYYDCGRLQPIRSVLIHGMCLFKNEFRTQKLTRTISDGTYTRNLHIRRRIPSRNAASLGAPSFRRIQAPFASTKTSCSCSPWFFVLLFPHDKNFAFIFDMQALVRLFLPCGSPCVRSTSDCAVLLRSWRTKRSGTAFSRFVLQTLRMPFVACNELAIATKSIASVCPHAEWTPWVPF